jgi:hypothetical protein
MTSILDSANTWFLESYQQGPYGGLSINLVEGVKGAERQPVEVGAQTLGPHYPVTIEPHSRCVTVRFKDLRGLFTFPESYDSKDPKLVLAEGRFLRRVEASSFREFVGSSTTAILEFRGGFSEWLVWTEEQIFLVLTGEQPEIVLEDRAPNLSIERGSTWYAS